MDSPERLIQLDNGLPVKPIIAPLRFTFDGGASYALTIDAWTQLRIERESLLWFPTRRGTFGPVIKRPLEYGPILGLRLRSSFLS